MKEEFYQLKEWHKDARRGVDHVTESFKDAATYLNNFVQGLDVVGDLIAENERLQRELEDKDDDIVVIQKQLQEEKDARQTAEVRLSEMSKLSAGVAKKSSQEDFLEVLQKFVNRSKHKRIEKRIAVKEVVLEMAMTNNITLPEDLMQTIESLDDEKPIVLNQNTYNAPVGQVVERAEKIVCNE